MGNSNYLSLSGLARFLAKIKTLFTTKEEVSEIRKSKVDAVKGNEESTRGIGKINLTTANIEQLIKAKTVFAKRDNFVTTLPYYAIKVVPLK